MQTAYSRLSAADRDLIDLHFEHGKTQDACASILGLNSQQVVSARLVTIYGRVLGHLLLPVTREQVEQLLTRAMPAKSSRRTRIPELAAWLLGEHARADVANIVVDVERYCGGLDARILQCLRRYRNLCFRRRAK